MMTSAIKQKIKIYFDTSVVSCLEDHHTPERLRDTNALWDKIKNNVFDVFSSPVMELELNRTKEPKRTRLLQHLSEIDFTIIESTSEVLALADEYMRMEVLSKTNVNDLLHIAHAVVNRCSVITSWNFDHFVNPEVIRKVAAVNTLNEYPQVVIVSPPSLQIYYPKE